MTVLRIKDAADLLGVSDDTVRRWIDHGDLTEHKDDSGRKVVDGAELALFARDHATPPIDPTSGTSSARNRMVGLVTKVTVDTVMAEVQMQCGPFTIVSLMSAESARSLGLEPGSVAVAVVKATTVIIDAALPNGQGQS
jgi:molybdopterin-binding protein